MVKLKQEVQQEVIELHKYNRLFEIGAEIGYAEYLGKQPFSKNKYEKNNQLGLRALFCSSNFTYCYNISFLSLSYSFIWDNSF